jgi:plasmid maintenance system antidote protein VapI
MKEASRGHGEQPGTFFKTSAEFWINLQMIYDLRNAEKALPARVRKSIGDNRSVLA